MTAGQVDPLDQPEPVGEIFHHADDGRPTFVGEHVWVLDLQLLLTGEQVATVECGQPIFVNESPIARVSGVYCTWCCQPRGRVKDAPCDPMHVGPA